MQLAHDHGDALQHINRLETGDHTRDAILFREEFIGLRADDRGNMAGQDERIDLQLWIGNDHFKSVGHVLVRDEHREVLQTERLSALDSHSNEGRGGLEANAYEHDLLIGVLLSELERIER